MKILIVLIFNLFFINGFMQTENYYIIRVKGEIFNKTTGKSLQQGDAVKATDKLIFKQKDAVALVISDSRGRFTLKFPEKKQEYDNALFVFVKTALVSNKQNHLSTRSVGLLSAISDLDTYFGNKVFNIIGDSLQISLSKHYYPLTHTDDVIARYEYGGQFESKKLSKKGQTIILSRNDFGVKLQGDVLIKNVGLFKIDNLNKRKRQIGKLDLRFVDQKELAKEFKLISDKFDRVNKEEILNLLKGYFYDIYGKTDDILLRNFALKYVSD